VHTGIQGLSPDTEAFFIHPVDIPLVPPSIMQRRLAAAIFAYSGGLRTILRRHSITEVACCEPGILWDMDTPDDYQRLLRRARTV
jgi:CTP:molybdopterin cytidylyltransferase MocA